MEWVRHSNATEVPNIICVYFGPKYETPSNAKPSTLPKKRGCAGNPVERIMVTAPHNTEITPNDDTQTSTPVPPPHSGIHCHFHSYC